MKQTFLITIVLIVLANACLAQKSLLLKLEKIKPLQSTEKDVESILGKSIDRYVDVGEYETKDGLFTVTYSQGRCKSTITPKYNVNEGIVIEFDFRPRQKFTLSSLGINLSNFTEANYSNVSDSKEYDNAEKGITYYLSNNYLNYIEVYPREDLSYLECPEITTIP